MKRANTKWNRLLGALACTAAAFFLAGGAWAQQKTVEQQPAGPHEVTVEVNHATVVYVEGNHLVTRLEDGRLEAILVPEDFRFHEDGTVLSVHELKPGMIVTETITTTMKPMIVRTVEIHDGRILHVIGQTVTIQDDQHKVHRLLIPDWAKVEINGEEQSVYELRPDMKVTATFITEEPMSVAEHERITHVRRVAAAPKPAVAVPQHEVTEPTTPPETAQTETAEANELPETASPLPLIGLMGLLSLAVSFGLRFVRATH